MLGLIYILTDLQSITHSAWLTISSSVLGGAILEVVVGGGDAEGEGLTQAVSVGLEGGH